MNPQLILALVIALAGFGSAWKVQDWRYAAKEHERDQQKLAEIRSTAAANIRRLDNTIDAQNKATARSIALRRDADALRAHIVGLSVSSQAALRAAEADHAACINRTIAFADVFQSCTDRYRSVVEAADRHTNDIRTLIDAYPKE